MNYMQEWIEIGNANVPVIFDEGGEKYYPITYISEKVLLRSGNAIIHKGNRDQFSDYLIKTLIDFGDNGEHMTNCIGEEGLKLLLSKTEIGRLSQQQRISQNKLHKLLDIPPISTKRHIIEYMGRDILNKHDKYTKEIIKIDIEEHQEKGENLSYQLCVKCDKHYPLTKRYFSLDNRMPHGFNKVCKMCDGKVEEFKHVDLVAHELRKSGGEDLYEAYRNSNIFPVYEAYRNGKIKNLPDCYINKENYLKIIKYLYDKGKLNKNNISTYVLKNVYKLKKLHSILTINEVYTHLFGENYFLYPWRYEKFSFREIKLTDEITCKVFENYLKEFKIKFDNPLMFDYENHRIKAKLSKIDCILEFAVKFNKNKYAGYMFKTASGSYYKKDDNLLFDLKYLVEKDMKIEIDKIPLYITKNVIRMKTPSIYRNIVTLGNGSLFYWFDRLYPNKFIETDFDINAYRLEFDSDTEAFIHDKLKDRFKNRLIYNQRNGEREIRLNGMSPDWLVFTDSGVWIIEYFGMFCWKNRKNSRTRSYIRKTINKLRRYRDVTGYNKLFLYLDDTYDDYLGIEEKIKVIENEINNS